MNYLFDFVFIGQFNSVKIVGGPQLCGAPAINRARIEYSLSRLQVAFNIGCDPSSASTIKVLDYISMITMATTLRAIIS